MIQKYRSDFTLFSLDPESARGEGLHNYLKIAGFNVFSFCDDVSLWEKVCDDPPHVLVVYSDKGNMDINFFLKKTSKMLPETRVILLSPDEAYPEDLKLLDENIFAVLKFPLLEQRQLEHSIDRAYETDYYKYMNEQISEELGSQEKLIKEFEEKQEKLLTQVATLKNNKVEVVKTKKIEQSGLENWLEVLYQKSNLEEATQYYLDEVSQAASEVAGIYLKYINNHKSIVVAQSSYIEKRKVRGLGVDFRKEKALFTSSMLLTPEELPSFVRLIQGIFNQDKFQTQTLKINGSVYGVFVFLTEYSLKEPTLEAKFRAMKNHCEKLSLEMKIHKMSERDDVTEVLDRQSFSMKLTQEISRARRLELPVSLLLLSVDDFGEFKAEYGAETSDILLRMMAGIFSKNSRVSDLVGRTGLGEFGILLPHTGSRGASIKAERLRRTIEAADFSSSLHIDKAITVSVGVSEYPSLCADSDDLQQTADDALYQVRQVGKNRVCLASVGKGFVPDFEGKEN